MFTDYLVSPEGVVRFVKEQVPACPQPTWETVDTLDDLVNETILLIMERGLPIKLDQAKDILVEQRKAYYHQRMGNFFKKYHSVTPTDPHILESF